MLKDKVDKVLPLSLSQDPLGISPELEGGCGQHLLGEVGALWDTWNCKWAVMGIGGECGLAYAWRSKLEDLCVQNHFCNGNYCP